MSTVLTHFRPIAASTLVGLVSTYSPQSIEGKRLNERRGEAFQHWKSPTSEALDSVEKNEEEDSIPMAYIPNAGVMNVVYYDAGNMTPTPIQFDDEVE